MSVACLCASLRSRLDTLCAAHWPTQLTDRLRTTHDTKLSWMHPHLTRSLPREYNQSPKIALLWSWLFSVSGYLGGQFGCGVGWALSAGQSVVCSSLQSVGLGGANLNSRPTRKEEIHVAVFRQVWHLMRTHVAKHDSGVEVRIHRIIATFKKAARIDARSCTQTMWLNWQLSQFC